MSQSEYQIPFGEHSLNNENIVAFEVVAEKELTKENRYNSNEIESALDNVYGLYDNNLAANKTSNNQELVSKLSGRLYDISENLDAVRRAHIDSAKANHAYSKTRVSESIIRVLFDRKLSVNYDKLLTDRELKVEEGEIGAAIFGPIAINERRAFFNDNRESWFFHQEKTDSAKNVHSVTLHYEVRPEGILRIDTKDGMNCEMISGQELDNFLSATEIYYERVMSQIYKKSVNTSDKLAA